MKGNTCQDDEQNQCWGGLGGFWLSYGSGHKSRAGMRGWSQRVANAERLPHFVLIAGLYLAAEVSINRALLHGNAVEKQKLCRRGLQGCRVLSHLSLELPDPAPWRDRSSRVAGAGQRRGFGSPAQLLSDFMSIG